LFSVVSFRNRLKSSLLNSGAEATKDATSRGFTADRSGWMALPDGGAARKLRAVVNFIRMASTQ
jgi:hypothetical protein